MRRLMGDEGWGGGKKEIYVLLNVLE